MFGFKMGPLCRLLLVPLLGAGWNTHGLTAQGAIMGPNATAAGPLERQSQGITADNPIPRRLSGATPPFPPDGRSAADRPTVVIVIATLDQSGRVAEARVITPTSPSIDLAAQPPFQQAAMDALRQWTFEAPARAPMSFPVRFYFSPNTQTRVEYTAPAPGVLAAVPQNPAWQSAATRVPPRKVKDQRAQMPKGGLKRGERAVVALEVTIGIDGRVSAATVAKSYSPAFDEAALEAVRRWEFSPALADGKPVPFVMMMTVSFQQN